MRCRAPTVLVTCLFPILPSVAHSATRLRPSLEIQGSSHGISKGLAQTTGPQFLARGELSLGRFYVGSYAKNVDSPSSRGEAAALVGVHGKAAGIDINVSAALKRAITPAPGSDSTALEVSGSASRKIGRLTPRLAVVWSPDDLGGARHSTFIEAGAGYALAKMLSLSAAVARRERSGASDYTAWNGGLTWTPNAHFGLDARYYDTDGGNSWPFRPRGVVSARLKF